MKKVRAALSKMDGVKAVEVDFATKTATVTMNDGKKVEKNGVEDTLKKAGYSVTAFAEKKSGKA